MRELFGLPTVDIMFALVALLGVAIATVAFIGITNRTMFRMGLRNLPRRGLQTVLVVVGLALATLITTAAFVTGDTIDHSLTADSYRVFGRSDVDISWNGERDFTTDSGVTVDAKQALVNGSVVESLDAAFAGDPDIAAFLPFLLQEAPATDQRTGLSTPRVVVTGVDGARLNRVGGLALTSGGKADVTTLAPNEAFISESAAADLEAMAGDTVTLHVGDTPHNFRIAGVVKDELASGVLSLSYSSAPGGFVLPLVEMQRLYGLQTGQVSSITVALNGGVRDTLDAADGAKARIEAYLAGDGAEVFGPASGLEQGRPIEVAAMKKDAVEQAQLNGNVFTTFFLVLGLFSMAAGVMLIFMIFVMLAAERKAEMGMSRAVGAQRGHLVQAFIAEGMAYSLLAGVVGVAAGVAASFGLTVGLLKGVGGDYFSLVQFKMTPVSLVIGYSLGVVITFITVIFASIKVSHVNITSAIRQLPEPSRREARRRTRWAWVAAGIPTLVIPPLGIWFLFRKGFGLPWAWIVGPAGLVLGALFMLMGKSSEVLFFFALGISLIPLSLAALARRYGAPNRPLWTVVGALLAAYWLMPPGLHDSLFGKFKGNIEMFVLSGIMIVVSFTLIIVFNARLLTRLFGSSAEGTRGYAVAIAVLAAAVASVAAGIALGDLGEGLGQLTYLLAGILLPVAGLVWASARFPQLAPALKMAVAYPLSNRFRTGMTIAMFSIIVFSLTVFSVLLANFDAAFMGGDARGNLDLVATTNVDKPIGDIRVALRDANSPRTAEIASVGRVTLPTGAEAVAQVETATAPQPSPYPVLAADSEFLSDLAPKFDSYANGFDTEAAVLEAVRAGNGYAIVDDSVMGVGFNESYNWKADVTVEDHRFVPFQVQLFNATTGQSMTVTVIGALKVGLQPTVAGVYINEDAYRGVFGEPSYQRLYIRLHAGADARAAAAGIQSALATQGVEAQSITKLLDAQSGQNTAFNRMFQSFMALGLLVGIAGLGVIAFRSVVERRQQIGMLRAIGYQRGTVTLTFLLESSFVAVMGILSGVVGGAILGRNLLTSDSFTDGAAIQFAMPWVEVIVIVAASFIFALLLTWWPSRGASRVPVAEALRYE